MNSMRVFIKMSAVFPQYEDRTSRLNTYKNWPIFLVMSPNELVNAGFFYTGYSDEVQCYSCGCKLGKWMRQDIAWYRHVLELSSSSLSRMCLHVVQSLTKECISFILSAKRKIVESDSVCKICYDHDIDVVNVPCYHWVNCMRCSSRMQKCPICRAHIEDRLNVKFRLV